MQTVVPAVAKYFLDGLFGRVERPVVPTNNYTDDGVDNEDGEDDKSWYHGVFLLGNCIRTVQQLIKVVRI